ncbi:MAG: hypothetical protein EON85_03260, partial [Brevundimonas sp.]
MTDAPPPDPTPPAETPDTPVEKAKRKRTRLQALAFFGGMTFAILAALLILVLVGGRMYLVSDAGRELVTGFVAGKKIGRYGRINVEGVKGDIFNDFTIDRVTVTDADGVWLEARTVHVDWSWWPLITRRFHATEIEADVIRLIRRPQVEPPSGPGGPQPLSIDIDRFAAKVELLEGFSKEYGRWNLSGEANIPRRGAKQAVVNADSLSRPGDHLRLNATFGGALPDTRLNLRAVEAQGGPIAGALGYSPDRPFSAVALINGEVVDATVRTGDFIPLLIKGRYGKDSARISGFFDFSGSDLLEPFVQRIGRTARFGFAMTPDTDKDGQQGVGWSLISENLTSHASGQINIKDRRSRDGIRLDVATPALNRLVGAPSAGPASYVGTFRGDATNWTLNGAVDLIGVEASSYRARRVRGPLNLEVRGGRMDLEGDIQADGGSTAGIIGGLLGPRPRVVFEAARQADGAILLQKVDATGQALRLTGSGGRNLLGGLGFRGDARITDASRIHSGARGAFGGAVSASMARTGAPWRLAFDGRGRGLATGQNELDRLLGATPRLQLTGAINNGRIEVERAALTGAQGSASARGVIEGTGGLRLALDWNARGPFGVGPVEIDGAMTGDGALTGTLAAPRADLRAAFARVNAGALHLTDARLVLSFRKGADASDGSVAISAGSNYGPARAA